MKNRKSNTSQRLRQIMNERNLRQIDIVKLCEPYSKKFGIPITQPDISQYVHGKNAPGQPKLAILGMALNVSETWLMGLDVPRDRHFDNLKPSNAIEIQERKIPYLGEIACGEPIFTQEEQGVYFPVGYDVKCDFCLKAKGDSMIGARINDGDIVFIKEQPMVENGEIAAVLINEFETEATLKRVYIYDDHITLQAENPSFEPITVFGEKMNNVRILGKAVAFQSDIK